MCHVLRSTDIFADPSCECLCVCALVQGRIAILIPEVKDNFDPSFASNQPYGFAPMRSSGGNCGERQRKIVQLFEL